VIAWVAMTLAGSLGALARYSLGVKLADRGTLLVNLTGAFLLGGLVGAGVDGTALLIVGTGFCGAYTTFSTWMVQRTYLGTAIAGGLAAGTLGWLLGAWVF
jgi:fluoride exporter